MIDYGITWPFIIFNINPILWNAMSCGWSLNTGLIVHKYTHFQNVAIEKFREINTLLFQEKGDNRINYKEKGTAQ